MNFLEEPDVLTPRTRRTGVAATTHVSYGNAIEVHRFFPWRRVLLAVAILLIVAAVVAVARYAPALAGF